MAILRPTYATRRQVKSATDVRTSADYDAQVDSALMQAADDIDGLCKRRFYNILETKLWDWPNFQRAYPWRVWFDQAELADVTTTVPTVTTGGTSIPSTAIFWGHWNYSPPFTWMELDRSQSYSFGVGSTPQRNVSITGLFGYWNKTRSAGTLAAAMSDTTSTTITVSDSSVLDAGDYITIGSESMLVQDTALADTTLAQSGAGCSTAVASDNQLTATGTGLHVNEVVTLDAERMLIIALNTAGTIATVIRAYDGTVLATHSSAEIFALRSLTVTRGDFGSTAATHLISATINALRYPSSVMELALAEAENTVYQKTSGYARSIGSGQQTQIPGGSLPDLRDKVLTDFGRKHRSRVV